MTEEANIVPIKKTWSQPDFTEIAVEETAGLGGGGPDFGSELS